MVKAVLYYFSLVHKHDENEEKKKGKINRSGLRAKKLARNSSAIGVPKCSSDSMLSSRYKNGKDLMPSSRYKANSRYVSIEAYPFALPCGERIEGERIDACSRAVSACWYSLNFRLEKIDFCLVSCTPLEGPPKPSLRWARCLTTGSVYFVFHCNNQLLLHFSIIGAGNNGLTSRPNESFVGGSSCVVRSFDGEFGSLRRYHRYGTQGTAGKAECDTWRVSPEHLARPIS